MASLAGLIKSHKQSVPVQLPFHGTTRASAWFGVERWLLLASPSTTLNNREVIRIDRCSGEEREGERFLPDRLELNVNKATTTLSAL